MVTLNGHCPRCHHHQPERTMIIVARVTCPNCRYCEQARRSPPFRDPADLIAWLEGAPEPEGREVGKLESIAIRHQPRKGVSMSIHTLVEIIQLLTASGHHEAAKLLEEKLAEEERKLLRYFQADIQEEEKSPPSAISHMPSANWR